jgi:hypothetical protein
VVALDVVVVAVVDATAMAAIEAVVDEGTHTYACTHTHTHTRSTADRKSEIVLLRAVVVAASEAVVAAAAAEVVAARPIPTTSTTGCP